MRGSSHIASPCWRNWRASQCEKSLWRPSKVCGGQRRNSSWCRKFPGSDTPQVELADFPVWKVPMASLRMLWGTAAQLHLVQQLLVIHRPKLPHFLRSDINKTMNLFSRPYGLYFHKVYEMAESFHFGGLTRVQNNSIITIK